MTENENAAEWLAVARSVLAGEFLRADKSTIQSLIIDLRSNPHPDAKKAVATLENQTRP